VESALERDFCFLLEFDDSVLTYVEQPVTIDYRDGQHSRRYTPDFLVHYADARPAVLAEIKYQKDIQENQDLLEAKFQAADHYARERGWEFRVYTEVAIRTVYLDNAKFLLRFRARQYATVPVGYKQLLLETLAQLGQSSPAELVLVVAADADRRAELLPVLWRLIADREIGCNLLLPLFMHSPIWCITSVVAPEYGQD
jgi:hypothetical protein